MTSLFLSSAALLQFFEFHSDSAFLGPNVFAKLSLLQGNTPTKTTPDH